jgi:Hg(II)-responsive transcriptional regulator
MEILTIGRVASRAGIGIETIRFYERRELIDSPPRSAAGYRQYPGNTVQRLRFIRRAKELGFSLKEIKELLVLHSDPKSTCSDIRERAEKKRDDINQRIHDLEKMRDGLNLLLAGCSRDATSAECPVLQALADE